MFKNILKFILAKRKGPILTAVCFVTVISLTVHPWTAEPNTSWWIWLEPITGIATLAVAGIVWLGEAMQDWESGLPKRLTVHFTYSPDPKNKNPAPREVMRCEDAYLASEADIRQWGQQIGGQMGDDRLDFDPDIKQTPPQKSADLTKQCYTVTFRLTKLPKGYVGRFRKKYGEEPTPENFKKREEVLAVRWICKDNKPIDKKHEWELPKEKEAA